MFSSGCENYVSCRSSYKKSEDFALYKNYEFKNIFQNTTAKSKVNLGIMCQRFILSDSFQSSSTGANEIMQMKLAVF